MVLITKNENCPPTYLWQVHGIMVTTKFPLGGNPGRRTVYNAVVLLMTRGCVEGSFFLAPLLWCSEATSYSEGRGEGSGGRVGSPVAPRNPFGGSGILEKGIVSSELESLSSMALQRRRFWGEVVVEGCFAFRRLASARSSRITGTASWPAVRRISVRLRRPSLHAVTVL